MVKPFQRLQNTFTAARETDILRNENTKIENVFLDELNMFMVARFGCVWFVLHFNEFYPFSYHNINFRIIYKKHYGIVL